MPETTCNHCGAPVYRSEKDTDAGAEVYCSLECAQSKSRDPIPQRGTFTDAENRELLAKAEEFWSGLTPEWEPVFRRLGRDGPNGSDDDREIVRMMASFIHAELIRRRCAPSSCAEFQNPTSGHGGFMDPIPRPEDE